MSKDPAVLFYTGDFLNGCTDLTFEERGQYITMLCLQHQKGHLSEKTIRLCVGSVSVDVMSKFKTDDDGFFYNERMEEEIDKRRHFLDTRYFNGKKGGRPIKPNKEPNKEPTKNLSDNDNEDGNESLKGGVGGKELNIPFDYFWSMYDKKVDRAKCEKKWVRLTDAEREECMYYLPAYVKATPDIKFRRNPETYLNNKSWQNEIVEHGTDKKTGGATDAELIELFATKYGIKH